MAKLQLRNWQKVAIKRSDHLSVGIFIEALGGRGKTVCALEICKHKQAQHVLIVNNRLSILKGWEETYKQFQYDKSFHITTLTDRALQNLVKKQTIKCDVLIIDEWQNMSSDKNVTTYKKVKRQYTIGLSATPIRKKGQNFYPLEKTIFGFAEPNSKFEWQKKHGKMVYDPFTFSKEKWLDFRNYDNYVNKLPNFMRWEEIEKIENAVVNNGYTINFYKKTVDVANPIDLKRFKKMNIVCQNGKTAMAKQSFGRDTFENILKSSGFEIDFPKIKATNKDTPLLCEIDGLIKRTPHNMLIVSKSKQLVNIIYERNQHIGIWTGDKQYGLDKQVVVATSQVLGVGVDGLQHIFQTVVVLDPVDKNSGLYDDYRQLLWRVTGSRQQHDVNIIEFYFKENEYV